MTPRVVVVGLGHFGLEHLKCHLGLGHEVRGAADRLAERRAVAADKFGVPVAADGVELIRATRPDLVSIVTGPRHHHRLAAAALATGARVLVEKPFADTPEEATALASLPGASDAVTPAHILRFDPAHRWVAERVAAGAIGTVIAVDSERHREHGHAERYAEHTLASLTLYHDLDLAAWLTGHRAVTVTANVAPRTPGVAPTYLAASLGTTSGALWTLRASWQRPRGAENRDRLQVFGTAGVVELAVDGDATTVTMTTGSGCPTTVWQTFTAADALREEIAMFAAGRAGAVISVAEAVECVRLVRAVEEAAARGGTVVLDRGPEPVDLTDEGWR